MENPGDDEETKDVVNALIKDLTDRARKLLNELQVFREHLQRTRQDAGVEIRQFRGTVQSEMGMLERLAERTDYRSTLHIARSSNLPFLEQLWVIAKRSRRIWALQKRIFYNSVSKVLSQGLYRNNPLPRGSKSKKQHDGKASTAVDIITNGGLTWTKLSLITNSRLLFDLAKQGWQSEGSDDEVGTGDETGINSSKDADEISEDDVPLLKMTKELCRAAKAFRVRVQHPSVRLILPRIELGEEAEIDHIIATCRAAGAEVICGADHDPVPDLQEVLNDMAPDPYSEFSETLNIDCTILLALVSEFSHAKVSKEPWFHLALKRQVEIEGNENLLPAILYPALGSHRLVCTKEAAQRMREIVDVIGTPSEKARSAIMMGDDASKTQSQLIQEMQKWSEYPVPKTWQLPIIPVDRDEEDCRSRLPPQATVLAETLTDINDSVFLYGWAANHTTITSNRTVVKRIEGELEKFEEMDPSAWPKIWLCPTARSLVGKELERRDVQNQNPPKEKKFGVWPLPDPLRREEQRRNGLDVLSLREGQEVEDLRPGGYPCDDVIEAKNASRKRVEEASSRAAGSADAEEVVRDVEALVLE